MGEKESQQEKIDVPEVEVVHSSNNKNLLILGVIFSFIALVLLFSNIYIYNQYTKLMNELAGQNLQGKSQNQDEEKTPNLAIPTDKQNEVISEGITNNGQKQDVTEKPTKFVYKVLAIDKNSKTFDKIMESTELLENEIGSGISLYQDSTDSTAMANYVDAGNKRNLYLVSPKEISLGTTYDENGLSISIVSQNQSQLPYILNERYCQIDADCSGRNHYCAVGAYNKYHPYSVWGCGGPSFENIDEVFSSEQKDYIRNCPTKESPYGPYFVASIDKAECVNNQCEATKVSVTCDN